MRVVRVYSLITLANDAEINKGPVSLDGPRFATTLSNHPLLFFRQEGAFLFRYSSPEDLRETAMTTRVMMLRPTEKSGLTD